MRCTLPASLPTFRSEAGRRHKVRDRGLRKRTRPHIGEPNAADMPGSTAAVGDPVRNAGLALLEQIVEGLPLTVQFCRCGAASLLFDEELGLKVSAEVAGPFVHHTHLDGLRALIAR